MKYGITVLLSFVCLLGAYSPCRAQMQTSQAAQDFKARQQQKAQQYMAGLEQANNEFQGLLTSIQGREKKITALKNFIVEQYDQNCAFRKQMYEEQRAFLSQQLDSNPNLQASMKNMMLERSKQDYEAAKVFFAGKLQEDKDFLDGLIRDTSIVGQELNARLTEFFDAQKADAQDFLKNQQQKYQNRQ